MHCQHGGLQVSEPIASSLVCLPATDKEIDVAARGMRPQPPEQEHVYTQPRLLPAELDFYQAYAWCLNPYPTVREAIEHLRGEIDRLKIVPVGWQASEVATNIFLLSCALLNAVEEYLRGPTLRLPKRLAATRLGRSARRAMDTVVGALHPRREAMMRRWAELWQAELDDFLAAFFTGAASDALSVEASASRLASLLPSRWPDVLQSQSVGPPTPFRRLDLTPIDVLALGQRFVTRHPDHSRAILLLGVRTSGSYFAPLLRAFLRGEGYQTVSSLTVQPGKGLGRWEHQQLSRYAQQGYTALIVDDPAHTGGTIFLALDICRRAGFATGKLRVLAPTHPARRDWFRTLPGDVVVSLEPEEWHKQLLLEPTTVECRLAEYFQAHGFSNIHVVTSGRAKVLNDHLQNFPSDERGGRLKRIYEVHIESPRGEKEIRYVLAKSVGWGWLGYHAFLAGYRLSGFVPPILGLRDGNIYMEWIEQPSPIQETDAKRGQRIETSAAYVSARVRNLNLGTTSAPGKGLQRHEDGVRLLETVLSRAYGRFLTDTLARPRLQRRLRQLPCPIPTLIDGKMRRSEWIAGPRGLLKTDYEHHGMGKAELSVMDPAYDLAETILDLTLTPEEERNLIRRYVEGSGDDEIDQRLFMNKLLAGLWAMANAERELLGKSPLAIDRQQELHQQFLNAWNFLTVHTARFCGGLCSPPPREPRWRSPVVVLDIDGVLDRRLFGFPCTTAAGIEALALLGAHEFSVALNTARSAAEVREYCAAYGLAGAVAEHGGYLWDAVAQRERVLVNPETMRQLDRLRGELQRLPGVFIDDRHQYSIRAFTYQEKPDSLLSSARTYVGAGGPVPLRTPLVHHLLTALNLDRLSVHQTTIDTTIVARDTDKGTGLTALRDCLLGPDAESIAVGDSEADLAMFRVATRSFAPAHIYCATQARLLGCQIAPHPYQRGLLDIARTLADPDRKGCERCARDGATLAGSQGVFLELLQAADKTRFKRLLSTLLDPTTFRVFVR